MEGASQPHHVIANLSNLPSWLSVYCSNNLCELIYTTEMVGGKQEMEVEEVDEP